MKIRPEKVPRVKNEKLRRLLVEEDRLRRKMEEAQASRINQYDIEMLRTEYKNIPERHVFSKSKKHKEDKGRINKLIEEEELLKERLSSLN